MKNKHKLILGIIIIIVAVSGYLFREDITGFRADSGDFNPVNLEDLPDTVNIELHSDVEAIEMPPGSGNWGLFQKYRVGANQYCIKDCAAYCTSEELAYYRAYVQTYGRCMCKCLPTN